MKKTILLLLLFLLLGGGTYWMMNKDTGTKTTATTIEDRNFAVKDVSQIGKVFIADRSGEATTLELVDGHWMVNNEFKARKNAMDNLLQTLSTIEMKYIPPNAAIPDIVKGLASDGIKVEIYDKANERIRTYYVGGTSNDERSTYCIVEGAEQPYAMHIPMMEGNLRARYRMLDVDWRDRTLFAYKPAQVDFVSIEYPKQKSKSFTLQRTETGFDIKPFYESTPQLNKEYRKGSAETFLMEFGDLQAEAFQNKHPGRDSIAALIPFAVVTVKDTKGATRIGQFHSIRKLNANGEPLRDEQITAKTAVQRYHVLTDNGDFMLVQQRVFGKIFWSYESFFK